MPNCLTRIVAATSNLSRAEARAQSEARPRADRDRARDSEDPRPARPLGGDRREPPCPSVSGAPSGRGPPPLTLCLSTLFSCLCLPPPGQAEHGEDPREEPQRPRERARDRLRGALRAGPVQLGVPLRAHVAEEGVGPAEAPEALAPVGGTVRARQAHVEPDVLRGQPRGEVADLHQAGFIQHLEGVGALPDLPFQRSRKLGATQTWPTWDTSQVTDWGCLKLTF